MITNIYIQSDFIEEYDKYLHDINGTILWKRLSKRGRNRKEIFKLLENYVKTHGKTRDHVAPNGTVIELFNKYEDRWADGVYNEAWDKTGIQSPFSELVIYEDIMAHRGEGKKILEVEDAIKEHPNTYASVLLKNKQLYSTSHRDLFIGNIEYKFTYISLTDDWRSNCGYVIIIYEGQKKYDCDRLPFTFNKETLIETPMFAFDYVNILVKTSDYPEGQLEKFYVDFNEAPGIPEEVVVNAYEHERKGECIPFSEIISYQQIAQIVEKSLKSHGNG